MRRGRDVGEWRFHTVAGAGPALVNADLTDALNDLCRAGSDVQAAQIVRTELVEGMRREQMLRRIRERLNVDLAPAYRRYTRRAWLELQGRPHRAYSQRPASN